jgi:hypothetical protein
MKIINSYGRTGREGNPVPSPPPSKVLSAGRCECTLGRDLHVGSTTTTTPAFFLVGKCDKFLFWSKVEAACRLETVITVITVIDCPPYIDHMDDLASSSTSEFSSEFFPAYLRSCAS